MGRSKVGSFLSTGGVPLGGSATINDVFADKFHPKLQLINIYFSFLGSNFLGEKSHDIDSTVKK